MLKRTICLAGRGALLLLFVTVPATLYGQFEDQPRLESPPAWEADFYTGYFSGGTLLRTRVQGEPVDVDMDSGLLLGLRLGADQEYFGVEVSLACVLADLDLNADPAAVLPSASDASILLGDINLLVYPTGNALAEGRVKPFITAGPGIGVFDTDFDDKVSNETAFDVNVGGGIKFLLGDQGNPVLRLDYRWHLFTSTSSGLDDDLTRQEITVGLGLRF
ncbi:MAG: outer membrane beta-barrel protein [Sedimentisphaerales bacterium]|nr:outer membrane beta-barrel protein [Sedimentisphaerales bacterium]